MKKVVSVLFIFSFYLLQSQKFQGPTIDAEILENYFSKPHYQLKNGLPSKILVLDTLYMDDKKDVTKSVYDFSGTNQFSLKKYKNGGIVEYKTIRIDSIGRIIFYTDSLSSGTTYTNDRLKEYVTRVKYIYKKNKKNVERIDNEEETIERISVHYDSLKNPKMITQTYVFANLVNRLETIEYDYLNGRFIHSDYEYNSDEPKLSEGFITIDCIIDKNEQGDVTKMYWPLSKKENNIIYEFNYTYDEFGNWVKMLKTSVKQDGQRKIVSATYRKIKYIE